MCQNYVVSEDDEEEWVCYIETDVVPLVHLIAKLFPELNSIKPCGPFDLILLTNWKHLRQVDLRDCRPISRTDKVPNICERLQKLEELKISNEFLTELQFKQLLCLPKLRTLVMKRMSQLNCIIEMRANDVENITVDYFSPKELFDIRNFINLHQVTLRWYNNITAKDIQKLISNLPLLQRLNIPSRIVNSEHELWETVACCPTLKTLSLSDIKLDELMFSSSRRKMEMVLNERSTLLTLHWDDSDKVDLIRLYFIHPNLRVSLSALNTISALLEYKLILILCQFEIQKR